MTNISPELIAKVRAAKSAEELLKEKETELDNAIAQRGQRLLNVFWGAMNG